MSPRILTTMLEMYYSDKKSETEHPCMNFQSQCWSIPPEQNVLLLAETGETNMFKQEQARPVLELGTLSRP